MEFEFKFGPVTAVLGACVILAFPVYALVQACRYNGEVDYCYLQQHANGDLPYYTVYGHRPWRPDVTKASYWTLEDAVSATKELNCPLEKK
jgi:hypothetical protein